MAEEERDRERRDTDNEAVRPDAFHGQQHC